MPHYGTVDVYQPGKARAVCCRSTEWQRLRLAEACVTTLLDLGMLLGQVSGACLAVNLARSAL